MDIQSQVAARRAELANASAEAAADQTRLSAERRQQEQQRAKVALRTIADNLSDEDVTVLQADDRLEIVNELPPLDTAELKRSKVKDLLNREARKRWTAGENWLVIGSIIGGVCTLHLAGFGLIPLIFGFWRGAGINKKHQAGVRSDYPQIFGENR